MLLVSTDPAHNLGHIWDTALADTPTRLTERSGSAYIDGVEINPDTVVAEHFAAVRKQMEALLPERMHKSAKRHLDSARHAPGSHEAAILERVADNVALGLTDYDLVIFDTAPTGHTLHLLTLPESLSMWTDQLIASRARTDHYTEVLGSIVGQKPVLSEESDLRRTLHRRRERFTVLRDALEHAGFIVVTVAEPMPVAESLILIDEIEALKVGIDGVIVNRRSPADAGEFLASRRRHEQGQITRLKAHLAPTPVYELPLLQAPPVGAEGIAQIATHLNCAEAS